MKRIILQIIDSITGFFNKIIDKESERVDKFYKYIFDSDLKERR
jgi:cell shape-determining protein MreC